MGVCEKMYTTAYGVIHYWITETQSERPWLVFLPGLTADHRLFDKQIEYFQKDYNCLVWDAPAHGKSRPFPLRFTMKDLVLYMHNILAEESIRRPVFIGQSMGGYIAQAYMAQYPHDVAGFISIDSAPLGRQYYKAWELFCVKHTKFMYQCIPWKVLHEWSAVGNAETEYGRTLMRQMMEPYEKPEFCDLASYGFRILAEAIEEKGCYAITCPTLLLCGERDGTGFVKRYNQMWAEREQYPLVWVPDAGHNANTDAPESVNKQIERFLLNLK